MSKLKHRKCTSLKELLKITRKYTRKFFGVNGRGTHNYRHHWYVWVFVDIIGLDNLNDKFLNNYAYKRKINGMPNLYQILSVIRNNYGWGFVADDNTTYILCGLEISNEDYYYIYKNEDGKIKYSSCVGSYKQIESRYATR